MATIYMTNWKPRIAHRAGPTYRAIADALETDVREGRLSPGDALPTQRELARAIGVNFTTVTRGYAEARRRGLINATVGRGTFVASREVRATGDHDLTVNTPPIPDWLSAAFRETLTRVAADPALAQQVLSYDLRFSDRGSRDAGAMWLRSRGLEASSDRVVASAGALHGLSLILSTFTRPGHRVLTESLAYPGLHNVAAAAGVRLIGVDIDDEGLRPDALEAACQRYKPKMLCCVPSLQNPTAAVMSLGRRRDIIAIARQYDLRIAEDDICGPLLPDPAPPLLASLAPDLVTYIGSLSKCVAPGLRTAFVLAPSAEEATRLETTLRAAMLMLSPLPLVVASAWIADGTAHRAATDIRREATARAQLARTILGAHRVAAPDGSLHGWLRLPPSWTVAAFVASAQERGVRVTPADWYVTNPSREGQAVPNAVRFTLGAEQQRPRIEAALRTLAALLAQPAGPRTSI